MIRFCPHCRRNVVPKTDDTCPGCKSPLDLTQEPKILGLKGFVKNDDPLRPIVPWVQEESKTPKAIMRELLRCKPLSDPGVAFLGTLGTALGMGIARDISDWTKNDGFLQAIPSLFALISLINLYVMFRMTSTPAVFLRAFTRDALGEKERYFLFSSMPKGVKLEGILAPRERSGLISRLFMDPIAGFKYLGKPNFSLEGGNHNWLARLLSTLSRSRFVLVDVRTVTEHVVTELGVCWKCCGPDRLFFVVDESRSASEWLTFLAAGLQLPSDSLRQSQLLLMPSESSDLREKIAYSNAIRSNLENVPPGVIIVGRNAFDEVKRHVKSSDWRTGIYESPQVLQFVSVILFGFIMIVPSFFMGLDSGLIWLGIVTVIFAIGYFVSYGLAIYRAFVLADYNQKFMNPYGVGYGYVLFSGFVCISWVLYALVSSIVG